MGIDWIHSPRAPPFWRNVGKSSFWSCFQRRTCSNWPEMPKWSVYSIGFTWIYHMNHVQFSWIYSMGTWPPQGLGWPRLPKIHQIPCLLAAIVHPHASRIECVNLPYFLSHMIHMGVSKRNRVYIPLNPQRSIMNMPKMAVLIDILMIE